MDRQNEQAAASVLSHLIPQARNRRTCLRFLADSILVADKSRPDRWGVTLASDYVRLNVGKPETLTIHKGRLHLVLDLGTLPKQLMPGRTRGTPVGKYMRWEAGGLYLWGNKNDIGLGVFSSVRGSITCNIVLDLCGSWLPVLRHSHHSLIEKAAQTAINPETRSGHSPNVITFLAKYLNREMPQPSYSGSVMHGESEPNPLLEEVPQPD